MMSAHSISYPKEVEGRKAMLIPVGQQRTHLCNQHQRASGKVGPLWGGLK